jgi:hypothetical protein
VTFYEPDGKTPRQGAIEIDFQQLSQLDTLVSNPPHLLANKFRLFESLDARFNIFSRLGAFQ